MVRRYVRDAWREGEGEEEGKKKKASKWMSGGKGGDEVQ